MAIVRYFMFYNNPFKISYINTNLFIKLTNQHLFMSTTGDLKDVIVTEICKAWNNLDVKYLQNYLRADFVYSSQMVLTNINGSDNYIIYLKGKYNSIKEGNDGVKAELGFWGDKPCIVLIQQLEKAEMAVYSERKQMLDGTIQMTQAVTKERGAVITFDFDDDNKIISACMCIVLPTISQVKRTGLFPI